MSAHHICDYAGVLALESCYMDLLQQRPADEVTRIAQIMGRFAHQAGAGARGAPTPEQQLLGRLHTMAMSASRSLTSQRDRQAVSFGLRRLRCFREPRLGALA